MMRSSSKFVEVIPPISHDVLNTRHMLCDSMSAHMRGL